MKIEIEALVVDDDGELATSVAELVSRKTGIKAIAAETATQAISYVHQFPIKVAILDQKMPTSGTDLYAELVKLRPQMRAIMLTGDAGPDEVHTAHTLGFADYLHKSNVSKLPSKVMRQYIEFESRVELHVVPNLREPFAQARRYMLFGPKIEYSLISVLITDPKVVDPGSWKTIVQINAGEQRRYTEQSTTVASLQYDAKSEQTLKGSLDLTPLTLPKFTVKLESVITQSLGMISRFEVNTLQGLERTYDLGVQERDSEGRIVQSRHLQRAPIFTRLLATIARTCSSCSATALLPISLDKFTGNFATRHANYYSDGTYQFVDTGPLLQ